MNGDEMSRGMYQQNRRPSSPNKSYNSPSANYSYNNYNSNGNGNSGYNNGGHQQSYKKPGGGGHSNHKFNKPHHGGGGGSSDKLLIKQNDQIIKLLKEIRDRLPAPAAGLPVPQAAPEQDFEEIDRGNYIDYAERGNERDASDDDVAEEPDYMSLDEQEGETDER